MNKMAIISITQGKYALVDDEDFEYVNQFKWQYHYKGYAVSTFGKSPNRKNVKMHRLIINAPDHLQVDHINGNKLDNRKSNLRLCTNSENQRNTGKKSTNTSGYKGVSWKKGNSKFAAQIQVEGKNKHIGYFHNPVDAAKAYNQKAIEYFGEFALLNEV